MVGTDLAGSFGPAFANTEIADMSGLGLTAENGGAHDGIEWFELDQAGTVTSNNPATGEAIGSVRLVGEKTYDEVVKRSEAGFKTWRMMPAPARGEIIRQIGEALRVHKADLGMLVSQEMGKILTEGEGEVQEMIDICDFAVGLSRQLYGNDDALRASVTPHVRAVASAGATSGSSRRSTSPWLSGPGTQRSRLFAGTSASGSRR